MRITNLISFVLIVSSIALAEDSEPKRGVLSDGTPFRTDAEGNQIIDYIAELENSVDNLHRRVNGLEREVETKQALIERLQTRVDISEKESDDRIAERDLVQPSSERENFEMEKAADIPEPPRAKIPDMDEPEVTKVSINTPKFRELEARNKVLEDTKDTLTRRAEVVEAERDRLQQQYLDEKLSLETALAERSRYIAELEAKLNAQVAGEKELKIAALTKSETNTPPIKAVAEPLVPQVDLESIIEEPQVREPESSIPKTVKMDSASFSNEPRASISPARTRALEATKGMVKTEINTLKGEIAARDSLYEKYKQAPSSTVKFTLSKLESKRGYTLDEVSRRLSSAQSISSVSELKRDVAEIRRKVQDDKALIRRLGKF